MAAVKQFDQLAQVLRSVVLELCSPSLTIRKLAQSPDNAEHLPASGWDMSVTPTVSGGFTWILPTPGPPNPPTQTETTDGNGFAQFQWEPTVAGTTSTVVVAEALQPGCIAGRPNADDWRCELKDVDGNARTVGGELDVTDPQHPSFTLAPAVLDPAIGEEIVTCTVWNSYDFSPQISVTKLNTLTQLRGDLDPPAQVRSTYGVTNPGGTTLDTITVTDDTCAPLVAIEASGFNVGDADTGGLLDPGEEWQFSCSHGISTSLPTGPPATIVNAVEVTGTDPRGTVVTAQATDDVDAYTPAIELTKVANGDSATVTVTSGAQVEYTYRAMNAGDTPLSSVTLVDVSNPATPCTAPARGPDDPGTTTPRWTWASPGGTRARRPSRPTRPTRQRSRSRPSTRSRAVHSPTRTPR